MDFGFVTIMITMMSIILNEASAKTNISSNSSRGRELQALMDFGWPHINSTTDHCEWSGIVCDVAGRVAEMRLQGWCSNDRYDCCYRLEHLDVLAFPYLTTLHLISCGLCGNIPPQISLLSKLQVLDISDNNMWIVIPPEIGSLSNLTYLNLSGNQLHGTLPLSLPNLTKLQVLDISYNFNIYGLIPPQIGNLGHLVYLDLSDNDFIGSLPSSMTQLTKLEFLYLGGNKLEGVLEAGIEKLPSIKRIGLSWNSISGRIPRQFGKVNNAQFLNIDLSWNNLSGKVPKSVSYLNGINLAYNQLEGRIPSSVRSKFRMDSFIGNPKLLLYPKHRNYAHIIYPVVTFFGSLFVCSSFFGILFIFCKRGNKVASWTPDSVYEDIIEATADFDLRHCIGTGGYGSVYRARLPGGRVVAVKKLHTETFLAATYSWIQSLKVLYPILELLDCWIPILPIRLCLWEPVVTSHQNWPTPWRLQKNVMCTASEWWHWKSCLEIIRGISFAP